MVEIIGIIAGILIVFSMVFKTTNFKGTIAMRIINSAGSIFFVVYGFMAFAYSTAITNAVLFILNIVYLFVEVRAHGRKQKAKS